MYYAYCMIRYHMLWYACTCSFLSYCYEHAVLSLLIHPDRTWCQKCLRVFLNMTTYTVSLQPPTAFCFNRPDEWAKWKLRTV